jgi:hypothetical protein
MPDQAEIMLEQNEILDAQAAAKGLEKRLKDPKGRLKRLEEEATRRGYRKIAGPRAEFGLRQKFKANRPIRPPRGEQGAAVQELEFEFSLRALEIPDSEDQAAIASVTITAGKNTEEYEMLLESVGNDFEEIREFMIENDQVVAANSWWTAARSCVIGKCGSVCIGSLVACSGTWAAYLICVAAACGGCWLKCSACATCNCRWWCRWATGCCSH